MRTAAKSSPLGVVQARKVISDFGPDVVLATGGYVAVPAGLAARMCRRPLVLHEQTVRLGLANRKLTGSATRIAVSSEPTLELLPEASRSIAVVTGNPVRPQVMCGQAEKAVQALGMPGFDGRRPGDIHGTGGCSWGACRVQELDHEFPSRSGILPGIARVRSTWRNESVPSGCGPVGAGKVSRTGDDDLQSPGR
ncbi:hypothetical protein GRC12_37425 [Streptomyces griseorubiginosus]|nr:hypothetical protein [Streptomyces griseorubiginosus]